MAIAHVCMECGWDLARVRVRQDPHYGLPLVICPRCTTACVRRRHPLWNGFDTLRRVDCVLTLLALQFGFIALFSFLTLLSTFALMMLLIEVPEFRADDVPWILMMALLMLPIALGAWLTVAFHHHARWRVWLGWHLFMLLPIAVLGAVLLINEEFRIGPFGYPPLDSHWISGLISVLLFVMIAAIPLTAIMIVASIGIPFGLVILWLFRVMHRQRWRWRRRMLRRRSNA